jgi:hypothetical protein
VTKTPPTEVGASVRTRLSRLAREPGDDYQQVLTRYANERLLYRLGASEHASRFVLKGAAANVKLQGDVGFGDAIAPEASVIEFPPLLDFPAPRLRAYPRETVVAEKLEAMVQLGIANSRMKDFYDIAVLARDFDFDGDLLARAIRATFERRGTVLPTTTPVALTEAFAGDPTKNTQWAGFVRKAGVRGAGGLKETVAAVAAFVGPPLDHAAAGTPIPSSWRAGGAWGD